MIRVAVALLAASLAAAAGAATFVPEAGKHFRAVDPPQPTAVATGKVEVIEFFSLGCPACASFEPHLRSWLARKPAEVEFRRVPAAFNPPFKLLAKLQLALSDVGAGERLTPILFDAIHVAKDPALVGALGGYQQALARKSDPLDAERRALEPFVRFAVRHGVDAKRLETALRSPSVAVRLAQAEALFKRYGGTSIPALAVDGRFYTHTARPFAFNGYDEVIGTLDHLARNARR